LKNFCPLLEEQKNRLSEAYASKHQSELGADNDFESGFSISQNSGTGQVKTGAAGGLWEHGGWLRGGRVQCENKRGVGGSLAEIGRGQPIDLLN